MDADERIAFNQGRTLGKAALRRLEFDLKVLAPGKTADACHQRDLARQQYVRWIEDHVYVRI
jgi:hypothetical protein